MINDRYTEYAGYIQENPEYYLNKFSSMEVSGKQTSWNWASFFFTDAWMLYRKMYKWFAITFIVQILIGMFVPVLSICLHILIGIFGNHLYKEHIQQLCTAGDLLPPDQKESHRIKRGGTSTKAICAYLIISLVLTVIGYLPA